MSLAFLLLDQQPVTAMCQERKMKKVLLGTILISLGALLLARNLGFLPFDIPGYVFSWKMLLIVIGVFSLIGGRGFGGGILIGIGGFFLAPEVFGIPQLSFHQIWPAFLILIGLGLLFKSNSRFKKKDPFDTPLKTSTIKEKTMEATAIFGGDSKKISSYDFKGGKATAVFGGLELDLTNCYLSNETAEIDIMAVCGGVSLTVPKEWNVRSEIVPVMGGIEDRITSMHGTYVDPAAELVLKGTVVMGGIEISRV